MARAEKVECAEEKVREKSETTVDIDSIYHRENLRIVWNNVRKIRIKEKQLELEEWLSIYMTVIFVLSIKQDRILMLTWRLVTCTAGYAQIEIGQKQNLEGPVLP